MSEVEAVDETDASATEEALASAAAVILLESSPEDSSRDQSYWLPIVVGALGSMVLGFVSRVLMLLLSALGRSGDQDARVRATRIATEVRDRTVERVAARMPELVADLHAPDESAPERLEADSDPRPDARVDPAVLRPTVAQREDGAPPVVGATEKSRRARVGGQALAREISVAARESARIELARELGATFKTWRTKLDARVRSTHGGIEGLRVPIDALFRTHSGATLDFPKDPTAPLNETAGCRCRLSFSFPTNQETR